MHTDDDPIIIRLNPRAKRHSWPWKNLALGDVVHVYAPPHLETNVYGSCSGYRFADNPHLRIATKKCNDGIFVGQTYIRAEVVDRRMEELDQALRAADLAERRAAGEARVTAALARMRSE